MSMKMDIENLTGKFLIAVPGLQDTHFNRAVVLICEHSKDGAFGLIINKVLMNSFKPLLDAFDIQSSVIDMPIYYGGPVKPEQGYVIYSPFDGRYGSIKISRKIAVTASREILYDISQGAGPPEFVFALGFAGWAPQQLEDELMMDSWLVAPLKYDILFKIPVINRWRYAVHSIGVDPDRFVEKSANA